MKNDRFVYDKYGKTIRAGSIVRVFGFQDGLFSSMPEDEILLVKSFGSTTAISGRQIVARTNNSHQNVQTAIQSYDLH